MTFDGLEYYMQHSGLYCKADAVQVDYFNGNRYNYLTRSSVSKTDGTIRFSPKKSNLVWSPPLSALVILDFYCFLVLSKLSHETFIPMKTIYLSVS